jgi:hypothetical protein
MSNRFTDSKTQCKDAMKQLKAIWHRLDKEADRLAALDEGYAARKLFHVMEEIRKSAVADYTYHFDGELPEWESRE